MSRQALHKYWENRSSEPTIQTMMLNADADLIDDADRMIILDGLPRPLTDMSVLEIGAGIGRFTTFLADNCAEVLATDFIESFIEKNRVVNGCYPNVSFLVGDAVMMKQNSASRDLVFTNWLLMYLDDEEAVKFCTNVIAWLKPGGFLHMRESCTESSSRRKPIGPNSGNPTRYRHVSQYIDLWRVLRWRDSSTGKVWKLEPLWSRSVEAYVVMQDNWRQCQMMFRRVEDVEASSRWQKVPSLAEGVAALQASAARQAEYDAKPGPVKNNPRLKPYEKAVLQALSEKRRPLNSNVLNLCSDVIDPFRMAQVTGCEITTMVTDCYEYSKCLNDANAFREKRVRINYAHSIADPACLKLPEQSFDVALTNGALPDSLLAFVAKHVLQPKGKFISVDSLEIPSFEAQEAGNVGEHAEETLYVTA